jgi:hypothetical protein
MQKNNYLLLAEEVGICDDGCIAQGVYSWFCENGNGMEGFALHCRCIGKGLWHDRRGSDIA